MIHVWPDNWFGRLHHVRFLLKQWSTRCKHVVVELCEDHNFFGDTTWTQTRGCWMVLRPEACVEHARQGCRTFAHFVFDLHIVANPLDVFVVRPYWKTISITWWIEACAGEGCSASYGNDLVLLVAIGISWCDYSIAQCQHQQMKKVFWRHGCQIGTTRG